MTRFAITLMAVTMAFAASAQALAPTWAAGGYGMAAEVFYTDLGGGLHEYQYDIYSQGHATYWDWFKVMFEFGDGGSAVDHILNMYDPGSGPELREHWTVNGITGNNGGDGWYGCPSAGPQPSYGDLASDTWIVLPTVPQADANYWAVDPVYSLAEGFANPYHVPSDYASWVNNPLYDGLGDAMWGTYPGAPMDTDGDGKADDLFFDSNRYYIGHMFDASGYGLMMTIRVVSDLGPYGETNFLYYASGTSGTGPILGPGAAPTPGDFDDDGDVDADDINDLCANLTGSGVPAGDPKYDLDGDGDADQADMDMLIHDLVEITGGDGTGTEYGDFDLDGDVDTTDLTILATNFGVGTTWALGNANCDLVIDTTDLTILATNFGFVASGAVPEPATMSLLALGGLAVLRRRRK